jgi:omega-6 fatty acid desaturase (delta-12 desaturase)
LLRGSRLGRAVLHAYGILVLVPPRIWRETHNYHHAHTAKLVGSHVGSYVTVNTAMWRRMPRSARWMYRLARHPLTILFGYVTVFLYGTCLSSFVRAPRKHWSSGVALIVHVILSATLVAIAGFRVYVFGMLVPLFIACGLGAYLFYAQHNYPGLTIQPRERWSFTRAALESSSYMQLGPVLRWFTGNIGYHHVHHLNPSIPFYRLPEAMAAIPELQSPGRTSLRPRDVVAAFRQNVWDEHHNRMITYAEAEALVDVPATATD